MREALDLLRALAVGRGEPDRFAAGGIGGFGGDQLRFKPLGDRLQQAAGGGRHNDETMPLLAMPIEARQGFGSQSTPEGVGQGVLEQLVTLLQRARLHRGGEQQLQEHLFEPGGAAQAAFPEQQRWQQLQAIHQLADR